MRILCLTTGGTIAGIVSGSQRGTLDPLAVESWVHKALVRIQEQWGIAVQIETRAIADIDSSDVEPELWTQLATEIQLAYDDYDAFVVTHGTNTMGFTAASLSFAITNSKKPIVITGSQIPHDLPASDALANLENAIRVAAYPHAQIGGVVCVFGSHLITGVRAKKSTEFDLDAFQTFSSASLGRLGRVLELNLHNLERHQSYLRTKTLLPAQRAVQLEVSPGFKMQGIISFTEFPGLDAYGLISIVEARSGSSLPLEGVVFRAFGAGDVSASLLPFFRHLQEQEIPVVVTTQAPNGRSTFTVNEPGQALLKGRLAIPGHDMSIEAMTVKLGWLLAQDLAYDEVNRLMVEDLRGEITVVPDIIW